MNNKEFIRKYRNIFWAPTTKLGNPLYKRTENNNDKELLKIEQEDIEFSNKIKSIWSSPSNIRAIFIGVNKAFIIYHKGISEGEKKVGEINSNSKEWILLQNSQGQELPEDKYYKIYTRDNIENNSNKIIDINKFDLIDFDRDPISTIFNKFALPNLEYLCISWPLIMPQHLTAIDKVIGPLIKNNKRLYSVSFIPKDADIFLAQNEQNIREYAKTKYTKIEEFIPNIKQFEVISKEVNLQTKLEVQPNQWEYDKFLSQWNTQLEKDKEAERNPKKEESNLTDITSKFKLFYEKANGIEVCKRDDYTVTIEPAKEGQVYYNKLEDAYYKGKLGMIVTTGILGEQWLQKPQDILKKYIKEDGSKILPNELNNKLTIKPKSNTNKCWAYQIAYIENNIDKFCIIPNWGENSPQLKINCSINNKGEEWGHGNGDWVIAYDNEFKDQAVINGLIFEKTYKKWEENNNINSSNNLFGSIQEFFKEGSILNQFIEDLWDIYNSYYEESKPVGIIYNIDGQVQWFDSKYNRFEASRIYKGLKTFNDNLSYNFVEIPEESQYLLSKQNHCFYKLNKALALGDKGILKELDEYLTSQNKLNLKGKDDFINFCKQYFYKILPPIFIKNKINTLYKTEDETNISKILNNFYNICLIEDIKKGFYKVTISNYNINWFKGDKDGKILETIIGVSFKNYTQHGNGNVCRAYSLKFATEDGTTLDLNTPMWAYKISDSIKRNGGISWGKIPIGKNIDNDKRVNINLSTQDGWMINLIAGSGSGKGVTTMAIVGQAVAQGWPILYLDCKPDMAKSICSWGGVGIDGNEIVKDNPIISQEDLNKMVEKLKANSISTLKTQDAEAICRAIIWTRAIEIFLHLQHIRAQFKDKDKLNDKEKELFNLIGDKKNIHPILVLDEYQAESFLIEGIVGATASKELKIDDTGEVKKINQLSSALINIINNQCEGNEKARKYLLQIPKWVTGIYGKKEAGLCGQVNTAFGRQAGCAIFTISQRIPKDGEGRYGETLEDSLKFYLGKYITIYGKDTDEQGASMYNANRVFSSLENPKKLVRGLFDVQGAGLPQTQIKTYLTIDNIDTPNGKENLCQSFNNDYEVASEILENVQKGETFKDFLSKNIKERRVDTLEYVADSNNLSLEDVKKRFSFSREYFDKVCQFIYRKSLVERLTDVDPDSFENNLGCIQRKITENANYKNWENLNKWAKIVYLSKHLDLYKQYKDLNDKQKQQYSGKE